VVDAVVVVGRVLVVVDEAEVVVVERIGVVRLVEGDVVEVVVEGEVVDVVVLSGGAALATPETRYRAAPAAPPVAALARPAVLSRMRSV
jgi:hypothetical protein